MHELTKLMVRYFSQWSVAKQYNIYGIKMMEIEISKCMNNIWYICICACTNGCQYTGKIDYIYNIRTCTTLCIIKENCIV